MFVVDVFVVVVLVLVPVLVHALTLVLVHVYSQVYLHLYVYRDLYLLLGWRGPEGITILQARPGHQPTYCEQLRLLQPLLRNSMPQPSEATISQCPEDRRQ